jgi:hypothetical protein
VQIKEGRREYQEGRTTFKRGRCVKEAPKKKGGEGDTKEGMKGRGRSAIDRWAFWRVRSPHMVPERN